MGGLFRRLSDKNAACHTTATSVGPTPERTA
jgi:hypothetical protein